MVEAVRRIGLVGAGKQMRRFLLPVLLQSPRAHVVGVCTRSIESAESLRQLYGLEHRFRSPEAMVASGLVDAVVAAANPEVHADVVRLCLEAGIDAFVEKAPCLGLARLEALMALESTAESRVVVGMNFRRAAPLDALRRLLAGASGQGLQYGRVVIQADVGAGARPHYTSAGAELLYELGIHALDLAISLFGAHRLLDCSCVESATSRRAFFRFEGPQGATSDIEIVDARGPFRLRVEAEGESGARFELENLQRLSLENVPASREVDEMVGLPARLVYEWPIRRDGLERCGYRQLLEAFLDREAVERGEMERLHLAYVAIQRLLGERGS